MAIISNFDNKLMRRKEIVLSMAAEKNPSIAEAAEAVSSEGKADKELVVVKSIRNRFGTKSFDVEAYVYTDQEQKARMEPKPKVKKAKAGGA